VYTLYDWAKDKGILFDEIMSTRAPAVSFTAGAKAGVKTAAHLHVYLPNMDIPVSLQVPCMPGMTDCVNEILLGLDNTEVLRLELSIRNRTYIHLPLGSQRPGAHRVHAHPFETASRQYAGGSHIEQVRPKTTGATTAASPPPVAPPAAPDPPPEPLPPPHLPPKLSPFAGVDLPPQDNTEQKLPEDTVPPAPLDLEGNPRQGAFVPIYFGSKSLSPDVHGKWDTAEAECWAIVCGRPPSLRPVHS
jgi:hypothetical protein